MRDEFETRSAESRRTGISPEESSTTRSVLDFNEIDLSRVAIVGSKGAHLGELSRIDGIHVPAGFCVTTDAFRRIATLASIGERLDALSRLKSDDRGAIHTLAAEIRRALEGVAPPDDLAAAITQHLERLGDPAAYAVRSSATTEDLPSASFAGQYDTYLNVIGAQGVLAHVRRCWASLFTDRAVAYRRQNGIDHRNVQMAVVVQRMVFPEVAGTLFTADPTTSNRRVSSIDASFGLGEVLVSGLVTADTYRVRDGAIVEKKVSAKERMILALEGGGCRECAVEQSRRNDAALTDAQIVGLERLGRRLEAHFGCPQDIEWCLADGRLFVVQSRPITTLYPIPEVDDPGPHVYVSVGHQQMMTDSIRPLGLSLWLMTTRASMHAAGGRLFVDVAPLLASPARAAVVATMGQSDPLIKDALTTILDRGFIPPSDKPIAPGGAFGPLPHHRERSRHRRGADQTK